jgi:ABC-type multidrug transport system fused ATPase/permease subunit
MVGDLRAIFSWIDRRTQLRWLLLVPIVSAAAVLEAFGALAVFGLLRLVVEPDRVRTTPIASQILQVWPSDDPAAVLAVLTGAVAGFYILRAAFLSWTEWLKESVIHRSGARAAERLFARYLAADYLFHLRRRSSSLIEEVSRSTDAAFQLLAASALHIVAELATVIALVVVLLFTTPPITMLAVSGVLALVIIPIVATRRTWVRWGERSKKLEEEQLHLLQQSLGAVKEVKIGGREAYFEERLRVTRRLLTRLRVRRAWTATSLRLIVETVLIVGMLTVILLVTMRGISGAETVSVLALFAYTGFRAVPSANRIMLNAGYLREGRPYARAVAADFENLAATITPPRSRDSALPFAQSIACEHVSFAYDSGGRPALSDIDLAIRRGESVGIVGPTGSGKSTLVDVLLGLLRPSRGRVLIDGIDLAGREYAWQRLIGYVPQVPYLLDDTLRRNVAFGLPDSAIDEQQVLRACASAQLDEMLSTLPSGLDTMIGERGMRLSGGQRQRVAIARALYHDPAVLVFDEATASLDNQTEREVTRAIAALHGARTVIVIAHRLTTVQTCDRLVFLKEGRIAGIGTYADLLRDPSFKRMAVP